MRSLPTWAVYLITGLGALVMILLGTSGTLLIHDRTSIKESMTEIKSEISTFTKEQVKINQVVSQHIKEQSHLTEKVCMALSMKYEDRVKMFQSYPLLPKN